MGVFGMEIVGSELDWECKDEFWVSCICRIECMFDGIVIYIIGEDVDVGEEMTSFRSFIEFDCILD